MSTPDPFVFFLLVWLVVPAVALYVESLTVYFSEENCIARRHERDWEQLQKNCAEVGVACPSRDFSDTLSDLNYYDIPGP